MNYQRLISNYSDLRTDELVSIIQFQEILIGKLQRPSETFDAKTNKRAWSLEKKLNKLSSKKQKLARASIKDQRMMERYYTKVLKYSRECRNNQVDGELKRSKSALLRKSTAKLQPLDIIL